MRWGRAFAGGLLAEVMLMIVVVPGAVAGSEGVVTWSAVIAAPIVTFVAALWVVRPLQSRFVLHGALAGVTAMVIYLIPILASGIEQPAIYWLGHALKVAGGAAGGAFAASRRANSSPSAASM